MSVMRVSFMRKQRRVRGSKRVRKFRHSPGCRGVLGWLERWREWLWCRWSDEFVRWEEYIEEAEINEAHVLDAIRASGHDIEAIWNGQLKHVVLGPAQLNMALNEVECCSLPLKLALGRNEVRKLCGLTVHLIPWFDGCLLLPELKESK